MAWILWFSGLLTTSHIGLQSTYLTADAWIFQDVFAALCFIHWHVKMSANSILAQSVSVAVRLPVWLYTADYYQYAWIFGDKCSGLTFWTNSMHRNQKSVIQSWKMVIPWGLLLKDSKWHGSPALQQSPALAHFYNKVNVTTVVVLLTDWSAYK